MRLNQLKHPLAITMWDFSWLERRWPGAGYEDWNLVLDQLVERGYNAIRIDAYPHLLAEDPTREWSLKRLWSIQNWGSPAPCTVQVQPALNTFISLCAERNIHVALSSWFREDTTDARMKITTAQKHAEIWIETLRQIEDAGLLDSILFVDLCNEWPGEYWAKFFVNDPPEMTWKNWHTEKSMIWMKTSLEDVREAYPQLDYCYSTDITKYSEQRDCSFFDLHEPHIWMAFCNDQEYYNEVGYKFGLHDITEYDRIAANAERVYRNRPEYWKGLMKEAIHEAARHSKRTHRPLVTTECWGVVDYKDWPGLSWDWVKELCEFGTREAAATGQWAAISTSNFCGPQHIGMWRDVEWHQRMTQIIRTADLPTIGKRGKS